jgi:peptidoglycan/xylan/chitin deacetylase (PgdA/CDA1 family)
MTRPIKAAIGRIVFASHLNALLLRQVAVVVAFHRVDEGPDATGLSIDPAMFERYCRFFRRHFHVIPLRALIGKLERGELLNRHLAITFDDGYRDNFDHAAPVLEKFGLPATFFVVSHWIGSDVVPWWDREQNMPRPWMTWDHVRSLRRRGFDVGAHTRTHADLGQVSGADAQDQILGGRLELERQLGEPVDLFAYPYGGRDNLAEANRDLVRAAGFRCCCSCYGGITHADADPFCLSRVPVSSWYGSPHQFGFELLRMNPLAARLSRVTAFSPVSA